MELTSINNDQMLKQFETVSVVMCTYNGELFIREQLESILNQSYPIDELIICDDCSCDNTIKIIEEYKKTHSVIKLVVNNIRLGFNKNFEKALLLATCQLLAISDQDDIWHKNKIEQVLTHWSRTTELAYHNSVRFKDRIENADKPSTLLRRVTGQNPRHLFLFNTVSGHAVIMKREFLDKILPFPAQGYYDWWLAMVAVCNGGIFYLNKPLSYQRIHGNNSSIKFKSKLEVNLENQKEIIAQLMTFTEVPNLSLKNKKLLIKLAGYMEETFYKRFSINLFVLLILHAKSFFYIKRRIISLPTWIKSAYYLSTKH